MATNTLRLLVWTDSHDVVPVAPLRIQWARRALRRRRTTRNVLALVTMVPATMAGTHRHIDIPRGRAGHTISHG